MAKQNMFKTLRFPDGTLISYPRWEPEQKSRSYVDPGVKRFPPPTRWRKEMAISYVNAVLGEGIPTLNGMNLRFDVYASGSKKVACESQWCGEKNDWSRTHCWSCGLEIPKRMDMWSSIRWNSETEAWHIRLCRDVTQSKTLKPALTGMIPPPPYEKRDVVWVSFVNAVHTISPIVYASVHGYKPDSFPMASFRLYQEAKHLDYTRALVARYNRVVNYVND